MPRPRSAKVTETKQKLLTRLREGFHRPGQRFLSNRAVARMFGLSYQTAHRLMAELEAEGWLARELGSGSFAAGSPHKPRGAILAFHPRARRPGSFGARLLEMVTQALAAAEISFETAFTESAGKLPADRLPIFWECADVAGMVARQQRFVVLLNDRPPPGLRATLVDSFSADDYSGGAAAAQILATRRGRLAVFAGPENDLRSRQRVRGFVDHAPKCGLIHAGTWFANEAAEAARRVAPRSFDGVFCCNDRLAEALLRACDNLKKPPPAVISFDDAPIAETLNLTSLTIPWDCLVAELVVRVQQRLAGDASPATQRIYAPHPVMRSSHLGVADRSLPPSRGQ